MNNVVSESISSSKSQDNILNIQRNYGALSILMNGTAPPTLNTMGTDFCGMILDDQAKRSDNIGT